MVEARVAAGMMAMASTAAARVVVTSVSDTRLAKARVAGMGMVAAKVARMVGVRRLARGGVVGDRGEDDRGEGKEDWVGAPRGVGGRWNLARVAAEWGRQR